MNKWRNTSYCFGLQNNSVRISVITKLIYKFRSVTNKIPAENCVCIETDK